MNFTVYSKNGCPYCEKVKEVLDLTKLSYVVYNLDEHFEDVVEEIKEYVDCKFKKPIEERFNK